MWIGAGRIVLDCHPGGDLREKAQVVEAVCRELRKLYNLSILEVAEFDGLDRCVLGFAAVMPESWREASCKSFIQRILKTIDETAALRVVADEWELLSPF
jgi:uncharacterized protein YlxP (DUF503 family)